MKIFGKILSVLAILCYILIAGVLFVAAPMVKGYKPVVILTGSMAPAYPVGTVVYYEPVPQGDKAALEKYIEENIKKGDVISFGKSDDKKSMVTHRVEAVLADRNKISTKGDANNSADPSPINYGDVFGKVIRYHLPYAGYVVKYLQNYYAVGAVFVILLAKLVFNRFADREDGSKKAAAGAAQEIPPAVQPQTPAQTPEWARPAEIPPPDFNNTTPPVVPVRPWPQQPSPPPYVSETPAVALPQTPPETVAPQPSPAAEPESSPAAFSIDVPPLPWAQDSPQEAAWDPNASTQILPPETGQTDVEQ